MTLTNYPINREMLAERQRERRDYTERMRSSRRTREPEPTGPSTGRWSLASWLLGRSSEGRRSRKARRAATNSVARTTAS